MHINVISTGETSEQSQYDVLKRNIRKERVLSEDTRIKEPPFLSFLQSSRESMPYSQADTTDAPSNQIAS